MRIVSADGTIEISRGSFDDPWDLDAAVESRGFAGRVRNIFPGNVGDFFAAIRKIEQVNEGRAVLVGTEDFQFSMELPKGKGDFWVEISMSDGFSQGPAHRVLKCRLHVDGEYWSSIVGGLKLELVGGSQSA